MSQHSTSPTGAASADDKSPKTERGRRTLRKVLDAAAAEFGQRGFHDTAISHITQKAGVALGTFYVYFNSKEEIFRAVVADMGALTRHALAERTREAKNRIEAERLGVEAYIEFVRDNPGLYRIVMESQFVAPEAYRDYYRVFSGAYRQQMGQAAARGEIRPGLDDVRVWALMGASTFLGLRYGIWEKDADAHMIADAAADMIAYGLAPRPGQTSE
jgi:AcrR family transcriptional regulator